METDKISTTETEQILKSISTLKTSLDILKTEHDENLIFFEFLKDTKEENAINEFLKVFNIDEETEQINQYTDAIRTLKTELNKQYSLNPTLKDYYLIVYKHDNNLYLFLDKRQNIARKTDINHFFYMLYKKHNISKYEFKTFRQYKTLSYNMKARLNNYLIHEINKHGHKKHYSYLGNHRQEKFNFYDEETRQNYKIKFDLSILNKNAYSFITDEIRQKAYIETRIKETQRKTKTFL